MVTHFQPHLIPYLCPEKVPWARKMIDRDNSESPESPVSQAMRVDPAEFQALRLRSRLRSRILGDTFIAFA